jgi:hypothetical protein
MQLAIAACHHPVIVALLVTPACIEYVPAAKLPLLLLLLKLGWRGVQHSGIPATRLYLLLLLLLLTLVLHLLLDIVIQCYHQ